MEERSAEVASMLLDLVSDLTFIIVSIFILQEFYADFVASDPYHFTLNIPMNHIYMLPAVADPSNLQKFCDRVVDGIGAVFLALKRRPVIRYQRTSDIAKRIAQEAAVRKLITMITLDSLSNSHKWHEMIYFL